MKKNKLSILLAASTVLLAGTALASCGKRSTVANAGEAFELKTIEDLKANSSESNPIEVLFWHSFGDNIEKPLTELIENFEEDMKEQGIYIDVKAASTGGGYDGLRSKVNSGVKSNSLPTMLLGYPDHFADYINSNILLPLDNYVNATDTNIGLTGDYRKEDFISSYWSENLMDTNNDGTSEIVGIPFNKSTEIMYYNASVVDPILNEHGWLDENENWKDPTWEQLWTVSRELKTKVENKTCTWTYDNGSGTASYSSTKCSYPVYIDSEANFFITTARQWCSDENRAKNVYTTSTSVSSGTVTFDNKITREAQNYFLEKANEGLWNVPAKVSQSYGSNMMKNHEAFISIGSTAGVNNNASQKYELKVTGIPQKSYDGSSVNAVIQQGTNAAILTPNSNNLTRLSAWLLIRYLTSTDNTMLFSKKTGYLPVRQSAIDSAEYQKLLALAEKDADKNTLDYVRYGSVAKAIYAANKEKSFYYTDPAFKGSSIIRDRLETLIQTIYVTGKTIDFAYEAVYTALKKLGIECVSSND